MNRVLLVGSHITFPEGFASTRFVRLLSKGLFETGVKVHVLVAAGHVGRQVSRGCIEGVTYEYAVQRRAPWHRRMPKWSLAMWELVKTLQGVTRRLDVNREDVILYYGDSVAHLLGLRIVGLAFRIPVIAFLVEWPPGDVVQPTWVVENDVPRYVPILQGGALFRLNARLFYRHVVRLSDGVIVISRFLEKKCTETATSLRKNARIIRVPVLVTRKEIPAPLDPGRDDAYLVFCAHLDGYLHDALFVVKAFGLAQPASCNLILVGGGSERTVDLVLREATNLGVGDRVYFQREYLSDSELADLYANAQGLLAPLYNDERSQARFPSKIADYLVSGRPVVSGEFGEVGAYLNDGESAFLSATNSVADFADKISELLSSSEKANRVGEAGRRLALREFDSQMHGVRLRRFLCKTVSALQRVRG